MYSYLTSIINYLDESIKDPFPRYIFHKEIIRKSDLSLEYAAAQDSKWYRQIRDEQWENGSWGRFHTMDSKSKIKQKFSTTESALKRAYELSLDKNDPIISRAIAHMERCIRGDENWIDTNEKHYGFDIAFRTLISANISLFDKDNILLDTRRKICSQNLRKAFDSGVLDEEIWEKENRMSNDILLRIYMIYIIWLLQNNPYLDDDLQEKYLEYIRNRKAGIYYLAENVAPFEKYHLESKLFVQWLSSLECLSNFSFFSKFMSEGNYNHLLDEANRLIHEEVTLPSVSPLFGHYSESWRNKELRISDLVLRITRTLIKCKL